MHSGSSGGCRLPMIVFPFWLRYRTLIGDYIQNASRKWDMMSNCNPTAKDKCVDMPSGDATSGWGRDKDEDELS